MFTVLREQIAEPAVAASIASIGIFGYVLHYVIKRKEFTPQMGVKALSIGLGYAAILGGLRVWLIAFDKATCLAVKVEWYYFLAAGAIPVFITAAEILKQHREITP